MSFAPFKQDAPWVYRYGSAPESLKAIRGPTPQDVVQLLKGALAGTDADVSNVASFLVEKHVPTFFVDLALSDRESLGRALRRMRIEPVAVGCFERLAGDAGQRIPGRDLIGELGRAGPVFGPGFASSVAPVLRSHLVARRLVWRDVAPFLERFVATSVAEAVQLLLCFLDVEADEDSALLGVELAWRVRSRPEVISAATRRVDGLTGGRLAAGIGALFRLSPEAGLAAWERAAEGLREHQPEAWAGLLGTMAESQAGARHRLLTELGCRGEADRLRLLAAMPRAVARGFASVLREMALEEVRRWYSAVEERAGAGLRRWVGVSVEAGGLRLRPGLTLAGSCLSTSPGLLVPVAGGWFGGVPGVVAGLVVGVVAALALRRLLLRRIARLTAGEQTRWCLALRRLVASLP